jgi:hypothetical protein
MNPPTEPSIQEPGPKGGEAGAKITNKEAVRRALARFGPDATTTQIQGGIKEQLGIDMTLGRISSTRGDLRGSQSQPPPAMRRPPSP